LVERGGPPRMDSIGIHTSLPVTVPFMKAEFMGACLGLARR